MPPGGSMRLTKFPDYESSVRSSSTLNVRHYALSIWSLVAVFRQLRSISHSSE